MSEELDREIDRQMDLAKEQKEEAAIADLENMETITDDELMRRLSAKKTLTRVNVEAMDPEEHLWRERNRRRNDAKGEC